MMDLDDIVDFDRFDRHGTDHAFLHPADRDGKERFVVPVKGNGLIGFVLQPAADQHKKHDATQAVKIARTGTRTDLIQAAAEGDQQGQGDRSINVEILLP